MQALMLLLVSSLHHFKIFQNFPARPPPFQDFAKFPRQLVLMFNAGLSHYKENQRAQRNATRKERAPAMIPFNSGQDISLLFDLPPC
jgi:hypothetical protein